MRRFLSRLATRDSQLATVPPALPIVLCGLVYIITLALIPRDYFWITDNDNKFLQMQAILSSGYKSYSIPWPGQEIDPGFRYNPLPPPFSQVSGGKLYSIFSPVFAVLSSLPYRIFGFNGLYLLPLLGSLLLLWGLSRIGNVLNLDRPARNALVLLAGFATPLWFYSVVFWEHSIAVALCIWAVYRLLRYAESLSFADLWRGSLLAALGVYFRDELYLFCLVFALAAGYVNARSRLKAAVSAGAVMVAALIPLWFFQGWAIGHPFGFHLGAHLFTISSFSEYLKARPVVIYNLFLAAHPNRLLSVLVSVPIMFLVLLPGSLFRGLGVIPAVILSAAGFVLAAVSLGGYFHAQSQIVWLLQTNSFLTAAPLLVFAGGLFLPGRASYGDRGLALIRTLAAVYLVLYAIAAPQVGSTGIHWGNRFVLVLYPLFLLISVAQAAEWMRGQARWKPFASGMAIALIVISLSAQVFSCTLLARKTDFNRRLTEAVAGHQEQAVVTGVWWVPQTLSRIFYQKSIFYAATQSQLQELGKLLQSNGITYVLFIYQAGTQPPQEHVEQVDDNGLNFFSIDMVSLELQ